MKSLISATALSFALTASALAADLPSMKAPPPVFVPPPPLWTGFYVGLNAGGTFGASDTTNVTSFPGPCDITRGGCGLSPSYGLTSSLGATFSTPISQNGGFIGGGQVGYNYQFNTNFVVGLEADIQGVASGSNSTSFATGAPNGLFPAFPLLQTASVSQSLDYIGTVRGRLGYLVTPTLLIFGSGGLAYGGVNSSVSIAQNFSGDRTVTPLSAPEPFPIRSSDGRREAA